VSRIGKKPVVLPEGVSATVTGKRVVVRGPRGELGMDVHELVDVALDEEAGQIVVTRRGDGKFRRAMHGTTRSLIANMVTGVTDGYQKVLEVHGVGYRARVEGDALVLAVGFSHEVRKPIPDGLEVTAEQVRGPAGTIQVITINGIAKELVGEFTAEARLVRPPEPYKGKGIRYRGEEVRRKEGKAFVTGT